MEKYNEPQIYVANNEEIAERLSHNYHVSTGNLGITKVVEYGKHENEKYVHLEYNMVNNLHEYRVVIIDLQKENMESYCVNNDKLGEEPVLFKLNYPEKKFVPNPLVLHVMIPNLRKDTLKIIFAGENYDKEYYLYKVVKQNQYSYLGSESHNVYEIIQANATSKHGQRIISQNNILANTIAEYAKGYNVVFELPTKWDVDSHTRKTDPDYYSLLKNQDGEVISYIGYSEYFGYELLLPLCEKKEELIDRLLTSVLPEILPDYFPESREFEWIKDPEFLPEEIIELENERIKIEEEYNSRIKVLDEKREDINHKYKFLNDLLTGTGDELVEAICTYFKWLEFSNVVSIDGSEEILREDI